MDQLRREVERLQFHGDQHLSNAQLHEILDNLQNASSVALKETYLDLTEFVEYPHHPAVALSFLDKCRGRYMKDFNQVRSLALKLRDEPTTVASEPNSIAQALCRLTGVVASSSCDWDNHLKPRLASQGSPWYDAICGVVETLAAVKVVPGPEACRIMRENIRAILPMIEDPQPITVCTKIEEHRDTLRKMFM